MDLVCHKLKLIETYNLLYISRYGYVFSDSMFVTNIYILLDIYIFIIFIMHSFIFIIILQFLFISICILLVGRKKYILYDRSHLYRDFKQIVTNDHNVSRPFKATGRVPWLEVLVLDPYLARFIKIPPCTKRHQSQHLLAGSFHPVVTISRNDINIHSNMMTPLRIGCQNELMFNRFRPLLSIPMIRIPVGLSSCLFWLVI